MVCPFPEGRAENRNMEGNQNIPSHICLSNIFFGSTGVFLVFKQTERCDSGKRREIEKSGRLKDRRGGASQNGAGQRDQSERERENDKNRRGGGLKKAVGRAKKILVGTTERGGAVFIALFVGRGGKRAGRRSLREWLLLWREGAEWVVGGGPPTKMVNGRFECGSHLSFQNGA